jgi:DNA-binding NarL/FixJ family response regulator
VRILCVEDDSETAALIADDLFGRGFDIRVVHDAQQGLSIILKKWPDLVLSDILLPGMSGFDLLSRVTESLPRCGSIPFIFLTALTDRASELQGRQLGADDYVTKPIDFDLLEVIIAARLAGVARMRLCSGGIILANREIETLAWVARGKTSAEIAEMLNICKRTVDFHIDNARTKLGVATRVEAAIKAMMAGLIDP